MSSYGNSKWMTIWYKTRTTTTNKQTNIGPNLNNSLSLFRFRVSPVHWTILRLDHRKYCFTNIIDVYQLVLFITLLFTKVLGLNDECSIYYTPDSKRNFIKSFLHHFLYPPYFDLLILLILTTWIQYSYTSKSYGVRDEDIYKL